MSVEASAFTAVRDTIERNLDDEPQSVVKVYEEGNLRADLLEYVLTDQLAHEFAKVLERVVESAHPAGGQTAKVGVWISGFFGSGKSHFAKLLGHLLADTPVGGDTTRGLFQQLLHSGRAADDHLRALLQQAVTYRLSCHLVAFDMTARHSPAAERNVGITYLRALYGSLGLSDLVAFAEIELELQEANLYESFLDLYRAKFNRSWDDDKNLALSGSPLAQCLVELLPQRFPTVEATLQTIRLATDTADRQLTIDDVVERLLRWLDRRQKQVGKGAQKLIFVADELGAWAGRDLRRIEQVRSLVETLGAKGQGRIWLIATSQEKLSAVVQNADVVDVRTATELLQRLEARFQTNVHLESSEVGTVIEDRILRKKPSARPSLEQLWTKQEAQLRDVAESPGLELGASYPRPDRDPFVQDYPFLPYQIQAAADIFGGMRGVKVSSGARSMIRVVFDATRALAGSKLGAVVSWDQIFDSANRDNEFADEQYLGSQGLTYIASADRHVESAPIERPSRLLKGLWLVQQSNRIPRTPKNLARLLLNDLDGDVLKLEHDVATTLQALAERDYVRQDVTTGQWRFLTQDEVTVEKIVRRIGDDVKQKEIRDAVSNLYAEQLTQAYGGQIVVGKSNTPFRYGVYLNDTSLKNPDIPVTLRAACAGTPAASEATQKSAINLDDPVVYWVLDEARGLRDMLRRAIAIERLENDEQFRQTATERTKLEARKLQIEAAELRRDAESAVEAALQQGTIYWAGNVDVLPAPPSSNRGPKGPTAKSKVDDAIRDRIQSKYYRFADGDRSFNAANVDKLFSVAAVDRASLDAGLAPFSADGHVHGNNVLVEALTTDLKSSIKATGQDVQDRFAAVPFGWPADLIRYVAAAMFVDGKLSAIDRAGKRYDDPHAQGARALFGTAAFRTTKLEVEEDALTPDESNRARLLLTDLGQKPLDGGEVALKEAALRLCTDLTKRLGVLEKARDVSFPLPSLYEKIGPVVDEISDAGSRVKIVRALIAHADELREADRALARLSDFEQHYGFAQYRRSQQLLGAALQAGLSDDPNWGEKVQTARDEIQALKEQRRVLDEWDGAYKKYRLDVLDAFKAAYTPLRQELHRQSTAAAGSIKAMAEYRGLSLGNQALIRTEFLGEGKPLHEVSLPELTNEEQLIAANTDYNIAHLRSALAALDSQLAQARARVIDLYAEEQRKKGEKAKIATWKPSEVFSGKRFTSEAEIDRIFDAEKERIKKLMREGKTVQVV